MSYLPTKSETTEFAQLQKEEDRIVMLRDVKNSCQKKGNIFSMSVADRRRNNCNNKKLSDSKDSNKK